MAPLQRLLAVALLFVAAGCATVADQRPGLTQAIEETTATPPFQHAIWGILLEDDDGTRLYERNAETLLVPASNRKLFAAFTIANCLGFDTQLTTTVWRDGEDLIVRGDGDPSLGSDRYGRAADFHRLALTLRERGIVRVRDVIADVSMFDRIILPGGWKVGNLESPYSAPVDALAWTENAVKGVAVDEPALHTAEALRDALVVAGITVTGTIRANTEPRQWNEQVASLRSPVIAHLLRTVLKNSQNLYTEMLFKRSSGGSYERSFALESDLGAIEAGAPRDEFSFADGSGLAPDNLVSPRATISVLRWMNEPHRRSVWWDLLAQPDGEGTLRRRLVALSERVRGKTGTINGVNALSGIIAMPDGRFRYFSVVLNHHLGDSDEAIQLIDRIVARMAE